MEKDALKIVLITAIPFTIILVLASVYIFSSNRSKGSSIKDALKDDLHKSGTMPNPLDIKGRIKYMLYNHENNEFSIRKPNDFSGNISSRIGLGILLTATILVVIAAVVIILFFNN